MAKKKTAAATEKIEPFAISPDDPLAAEQAAVALWVEEAVQQRRDSGYYTELDLKSIASGQALLAGNAGQSLQYVLAAVEQASYWDQLEVSGSAELVNPQEYNSPENAPYFRELRTRRNLSLDVLRALMKRTLPFERDSLISLLQFLTAMSPFCINYVPFAAMGKVLDRYAANHLPDDELRSLLRLLVIQLGSVFEVRTHFASVKEAKKLIAKVEQLLTAHADQAPPDSEVPASPPPVPAPAGTPGVLVGLKCRLQMLPAEELPSTTLLELDQFPVPDNSPLRQEYELLAKFHQFAAENVDGSQAECLKFLKRNPEEQGRLLLAAIERRVNSQFLQETGQEDKYHYYFIGSVTDIVIRLLTLHSVKLERSGLFDLLLFFSLHPQGYRPEANQQLGEVINVLISSAETHPLTEGERFVLSLYRSSLISSPPLGTASEKVMALTRLINDGAKYYLVPGEVWTEALNTEIAQLAAPERTAWIALLQQAVSASSARPSAKWLKTADQLLEAIGKDQVAKKLLHWFSLVQQGKSQVKTNVPTMDYYPGSGNTIHPENADCLRGLLWCVPFLPRQEELIRAVTALALFCYKKIPGIGPRAVKVGNAAIYTLSELGTEAAVGQLAMLKLRVKFGTAQKEIEKAFDAAARALGLPRDQIEELGVPAYGLEEVGRTSTELGDYRAELQVTGSNAQLQWFDAKGKALKSVPAKVKSEFKEDLKDLQQSLKDIQAMLPAQRDRIDSLFLLQKSWPISVWQERYLQHPLIGTIAQRLVWCVDGTPVLFLDGVPTGLEGTPLEHGKTSEITLWHPVGRSVEEITGWRRRVEELGITQPFKQVYREVYLLTDAERNTRTYSNRFAAHIIRQHQFNALCAARGWKNMLRLLVDDTYPPATKELPGWGLRAEYWVEGIGEDYGIDTNDAGTYLRLVTDQVRFYRTGAAVNYVHASGGGYESAAAGPGQDNLNEPLPLEEVPALVLSEIMRDVDLFVGVASVGNDPTWQDGGPEGRYRDYWQHYSFGELSGTAATRKQVLERLVPRLKIASRCSFNDRFLVVQGDKRTYKIHLGSGNILMEPNDQYLCIVPDARARAAQGDVYLPFEGDATLSIIISKALLLAEDTKIKDASITQQIDLRV